MTASSPSRPLVDGDAHAITQVSGLGVGVGLPARHNNIEIRHVREMRDQGIVRQLVPGSPRLIAAQRPRIVEKIGVISALVVLYRLSGVLVQPVEELFLGVVALLFEARRDERIGDDQRTEEPGERAEQITHLVIELDILIGAASARHLARDNSEPSEKADDVVFLLEAALHMKRRPW